MGVTSIQKYKSIKLKKEYAIDLRSIQLFNRRTDTNHDVYTEG